MALVNNRVIRQVTVDALKANTNVTALVAATKIYNSKVTPHLFGNLPAIGIFTNSTATQGVNHVVPGFVKTLDINVEIAVSGVTSVYMDTADNIIHAVKNALFANTTWHGQFENVAGYTEETILDDQGEQPISLTTLTISCEIVEAI